MLAWCGLSLSLLGACGGGDGGLASVRGTGRLPECQEEPSATLDGTVWFDTGQLSIQSAGCSLAQGSVVDVCPLQWELSQQGNDLHIRVDGEYDMNGRLCGNQLYLDGGWWLAVEDDGGQCGYQDDDGTEVGIEAEGNTLTLSATQDQLTGTLVLRERCVATYDVTLQLLYGNAGP